MRIISRSCMISFFFYDMISTCVFVFYLYLYFVCFVFFVCCFVAAALCVFVLLCCCVFVCLPLCASVFRVLLSRVSCSSAFGSAWVVYGTSTSRMYMTPHVSPYAPPPPLPVNRSPRPVYRRPSTKGVVEGETYNPHFCMPGPPNEIGILILRIAWSLHDERVGQEEEEEKGEGKNGGEK